MSTKVQLEIRPLPDESLGRPFIIKVSDQIMKALHLSSNQDHQLTCSRYSHRVRIVSIKESDSIMYCSKTLLQSLHLPTEFTFTISLTKTNHSELFLNPIVSVMTEVKEKGETVSLGSIEAFCEELAYYCDSTGVFFYVFSLNNWDKENLVGYVFNNNRWIKTPVPFPQVVHNRIHSRKREQSTKFIEFIEDLNSTTTPYFNDHFLNKWEVHELLVEHDHITPYIPETMLLTSRNVLEEMVDNHDCVFLKPIHGSQGRKIFRITKKESNYHLDYTTFTGDIEQTYDSFLALFQSLRSRLNQQGFVAQQGLPLLLYNYRPLDFRFLCHKTIDNKWAITSAIARVSSKEQFVSNLARGGELMKLSTILSDTFDQKTSNHIKKMMKELALEVADIISLSCEGFYGELGIDLALDINGVPWVIEVNTKPSKDQDPEHISSKVRPSAKAIIQHCLYLTNFSKKE